MRDITLMPNDYIVTHIKTDTICEHYNNDDVVYVVDTKRIPLVRCKDCIHFDGFNCNQFGEPAECSNPCSDDGNDYCSFGERKENK